MSNYSTFTEDARDLYQSANQRALYWQLDRISTTEPLINTKLNSLSLTDYDKDDGLRSPDFVYGWIQGRGLEALILHARYFENIDQQLSQRLYRAAESLYPFLNNLIESRQGAFFLYNTDWQPVCRDDPSGKSRQKREPNIATYSDLFCVKGLITAATHFAPDNLSDHFATLRTIIDAIEEDRFLINEAGHITEAALAEQRPDFGPRMIALGAAAMLHEIGHNSQDSFSERFIEYILIHHLDTRSGLVANEPDGELCNIGHGIEFAGFALDCQRKSIKAELATELSKIINASFKAGFNGTGIMTSINLRSMAPVNDVCPWWSLPETIRAASLAYEATADAAQLNIWQAAHNAFFDHYWRVDPPIAYQSMTSDGPVDVVPSTPDLDPGYHTGLSLRIALQMTDRQ